MNDRAKSSHVTQQKRWRSESKESRLRDASAVNLLTMRRGKIKHSI